VEGIYILLADEKAQFGISLPGLGEYIHTETRLVDENAEFGNSYPAAGRELHTRLVDKNAVFSCWRLEGACILAWWMKRLDLVRIPIIG
jgi:hypothetical protein